MSFTTRAKVRFADVDPAGIVFYPRYFEMLNAAVEDWFAQGLGVDFATLHLKRRLGTPTVRLECDFLVPSELGDTLDIEIGVASLGRTSCNIAYRVSGGGVDRLRAKAVLVCMDLDAQKAVPWPDDLRAAIGRDLVEPATAT